MHEDEEMKKTSAHSQGTAPQQTRGPNETPASEATDEQQPDLETTSNPDLDDSDADTDAYELRGLFWMSPRQVLLAERYHHVCIHDNTYKCNRFGMALGLFTSINHHSHTVVTAQCLMYREKTEDYEWAFKCFIAATGKIPRVLFTDREHAVEAAILSTFPSSTRHFW